MVRFINGFNRLFGLLFAALLALTGGLNRAFSGDVYPWQSETDVVLAESLLRAQGVTTDGSAWIFSGRAALQRVDIATGKTEAVNLRAIPDPLRTRFGVKHIGGVSAAEGKLYVPMEDSKAWRHPLIAVFDAVTLEYTGVYGLLDSVRHPHGVPWVSADAAHGVLYTGDGRNYNEIYIYDLASFTYIGAIALSEPIVKIQGGEVRGGLLYVAANDATRAVYTVDTATGAVTKLFDRILSQSDRIGNFGGEGEDLTLLPLPDGTAIHTLQTGATFLDVTLRHYAYELT